jgi:hypothetical protein
MFILAGFGRRLPLNVGNIGIKSMEKQYLSMAAVVWAGRRF